MENFFKKEFISDYKDISENTFECLKSSVKLQSSDLKDVSISLSGGIDSSLIAAILKRYFGKSQCYQRFF